MHFNCFRHAYADFPAGTVTKACQPDPYFIVQDGNWSIGIEFTEYLRQSPHGPALWHEESELRRQESEREQAIENARDIYIRKDLPPLEVRIYWSPHFTLTKKQRPILANEIAELVATEATNLPEAGAQVTLENTGLANSVVPEEIHSITIARFVWSRRNHWAASVADYPSSLKSHDIIKIIQTKEQKLGGYRRICAQVWLVCVIEGFRPSSFAEFLQSVIDESYQTAFEKVFLLECFEGQVVELHTANTLPPH
jgi:hypothetical protein